MVKTLLIFDLDGTLINTVKDLNIATNYALKKYNLPLRTVEQTTADIGNGVAVLIARSIPIGINNPDYKDILSQFKSYYREHYFENSFPYDGVKETLLKLKEHGYKLAVVSNKFNEGANKLVNHYFEGIFDIIQGHEEKYNPKPSSDMVNAVLQKLAITHKETLYIGDTNVDYETAVNSGIDSILVTYGYRSKEYILKNIKNSKTIDHISELIDYLSNSAIL